MNLVITTETYLPFVAGVSTSTDNIARFMARRGHHVTIVCPKPVLKDPVPPEKNLTITHTPSLPDPFFNGKSFSPFPMPFRMLRNVLKDTDLVHIQEPGAVGYTALYTAKRRDIPVVGALHFTPEQIFRILFFPKLPLFIKIVKRYIRWFYNQCDGIMVPTETFARFLRETGVSKPIQVVSNGVDTEDFVPTKDRMVKRDLYRLPNDKILFFFLGRLDIDKHADTIIRALPKTENNVHLVIAGEGKEEGNFRALAASLGVEGRITWLGYINHEQMKDVYQSVDAFVLMSPYEVQSIVTLQAIASGLPVLACKEGALPELCHNGINGFTISLNDDTALSEKMNVLAGDESLREKMGKESRTISLPHDRETALAKLLEFYKKIVASRKQL
jgi:glycosyltransferase involved in cell wall biosynthesis